MNEKLSKKFVININITHLRLNTIFFIASDTARAYWANEFQLLESLLLPASCLAARKRLVLELTIDLPEWTRGCWDALAWIKKKKKCILIDSRVIIELNLIFQGCRYKENRIIIKMFKDENFFISTTLSCFEKF